MIHDIRRTNERTREKGLEHTSFTSLHVNLTLSSFHPAFFLPPLTDTVVGLVMYNAGRDAFAGVEVVRSMIRS